MKIYKKNGCATTYFPSENINNNYRGHGVRKSGEESFAMDANKPPHEVRILVEKNLACKTRDGVLLFADVYRPSQEGRFPVILHRTPYNKNLMTLSSHMQIDPVSCATRGYVVVVQDVRGRFSSGGTFDPLQNHEIDDAYDTIEWASNFPYSTGKVGMVGGSYTGATQFFAAASGHPNLIAIVPRQTGSNYYKGWTYEGGALLLGFDVLWSIALAFNELSRKDIPPGKKEEISRLLAMASDNLSETCSGSLKDLSVLKSHGLASYFFKWLDHPCYDGFWKNIDLERKYEQMSDVAGLHIAGWYDIFLKGSIKNYQSLRDRRSANQELGIQNRVRQQRLIIGPWTHGGAFSSLVGEWNAGRLAEGAHLGLEEMHLKWFDYWLKDIPTSEEDQESPVMIFVMGKNTWRREREWPLARTQFTKFYLRSSGNANTSQGDGLLDTGAPVGEEGADSFVFNPEDPVPTRGGGSTGSLFPALPPGVYDQRTIELRNDVLVYSSCALKDDLEITGPVTLHLYASSTAPDTDFTAKLVDVYEDDYAFNLCDSIIRARFRDSFVKPNSLKPGSIELYSIDLGATSNVFLRGHRVRLEISSSNFPKFDLNKCYDENGETLKPTQRILHSPACPSHLILPLIRSSA